MKRIRGNFFIPHSYFYLCPLLAFGDFLKLRVELRQLGGVQAELGNAALVIDRHRGLVGDGALDVVDADVIAEDRPRVRVRLLDGRAGDWREAGPTDRDNAQLWAQPDRARESTR